jgi:hypothetical protein
MLFKITYSRGTELKKAFIEAPDVVAAMKKGYKECAWESVLEVSTADDKPLQAVAAAAPAAH